MNSLQYDLAFLLPFLSFFLLKYTGFNKKKKELGSIEIKTPGGIRNSDVLLQVLVFIILTAIISIAYLGKAMNDQGLFIMLIFMGVFFGFMCFTGFMASTQKGLYENGIVTMGGVILYSQIKDFSIRHRRKNKGLTLFIEKNGSTFLSGNDFVHIEFSQKTSVNQMIKKNTNKKAGKKKKKR